MHVIDNYAQIKDEMTSFGAPFNELTIIKQDEYTCVCT
jgi:hypothetical protein